MKSLTCLLVLVLLLGACNDGTAPMEPELRGPQLNILDGANGVGGNRHFFFLPPLLANPTYSGTFDGSLSPVVEICQRTTSGCATPLVAQFTTTSGPGSETVRVDMADEQYVVNWHTARFSISLAHTYRVRVLIAGTELGFADVKFYDNPKKARDAGTATEVALVAGKTVPIKFRVEVGAVYVVSPPQPGDPPAVITSTDGNVAMSLPEGSVSEPIGITIEAIAPPTTASNIHLVGGTTYEFGPDGTQFATPITATLQYDPAELPPNRAEESLRLTTLVDGRWEWVPGSRVDPATNTVAGELQHFSTYAVASADLIAMGRGEYAGADATCAFYTMYADGSGFTGHPAAADYAVALSWSPDGTKLAYVTNNSLYVSDGSTASLLVGDTYVHRQSRPAWSPDGSTIAFQGWENIFTVDSAGSTAPVQITHVSGYWAFDPSWSHDGSRIVFALDSGTSSWNPEGQSELHTMLPDGTDPVKLTTTVRTEWAPVYSADGSKLAFAAYEYDTGIWSLEVMDVATGGATTTLVAGSHLGGGSYGLYPRWTPGGKILYSALNTYGEPEYWTIYPDGSGNQILIDYHTFQSKSSAACGYADTPGPFADWQP